jgi:hypothetical protein
LVWGLGLLGLGPKPQSPIPNPQSPYFIYKFLIIINYHQLYYIIMN